MKWPRGFDNGNESVGQGKRTGMVIAHQLMET